MIGSPASIRRIGRRTVATTAAAVAASLASASIVRAGLSLDTASNALNGTNGGLLEYSGGTPDYYMGDPYVLKTGATDITGFDIFPYNGTITNTSTEMSFTNVEANVYFWGSVNTGTVTASNPAFGNELGMASVDLDYGSPGLQPGYYGEVENTSAPGTTPGITFTTPIPITSTTIGVTIEYEGSTDGGNTFADYQYLTNFLSFNASASVGTILDNGYYRGAAGETTGNFNASSDLKTNAGYTNQTVALRVYSDLPSINYQWNNASGGAWETTTNWNPNGLPTSSDVVNFNLASTPGYTVNVNTATDACLTLNVESDNVTIAIATSSVLNASQSALTVAGTLTVAQPPTATTTATTYGYLTLAKSGNGSSTTYAFTNTNAVVVGGSNTAGGIGIGKLTIGSGVLLNNQTSLNISAGSSVVIQPGGVLGTGTLNLAGFIGAWTSTIDITTNALDLSSANLSIVNNQVASGYNLAGGAKWNGFGITSSAAGSDTRHLTAVGVIQNNQNGSPLYGSGGSIAATFDNDTFVPDAGDILVKYTYFGDANLDGKIDGSDYSLIDAGYNSGGNASGWYNGDFNYDGVIDGSDYALIDNAFNNQNEISTVSPDIAGTGPLLGGTKLGQSESAAGLADGEALIAVTNAQVAPSAVPEPAGLAGLALGVGALFRRAKRRTQPVA